MINHSNKKKRIWIISTKIVSKWIVTSKSKYASNKWKNRILSDDDILDDIDVINKTIGGCPSSNMYNTNIDDKITEPPKKRQKIDGNYWSTILMGILIFIH